MATIQAHEGSSQPGRLSATIYGSHRLQTRTGIAWTSRVRRTFPRRRSIPIRRDVGRVPQTVSLDVVASIGKA